MMLNHHRIIDRLIMQMVKAYWRSHFGLPGEEWVPHTELCKITPAYSQRFGEWKTHGIMTEKKPDGEGGYFYRLTTCPDSVDWPNLKLKISNRPIRQKPGVKVPQEDLF